MLYKLISTEGDQTFELRVGQPLILGRALNSDIPILDPTISRKHAELTPEENGVQVRDLGSSNGTYLNGVRVETARVSPGDVVTFGKVPFRLKEHAVVPEGVAIPTPVSLPPRSPGATIVRQVPARDSDQALAAVLRHSGPQRAVVDTGPVGAVGDRSQQRLALLLEISKALSRVADLQALLDQIADFSFQIFDVERVSILLYDERGELVPHVARDKRGSSQQRTVPQSILRPIIEDRVAVLSDDAGTDERFGGQSILMQRVRSAMGAPLTGAEHRVLGAIYVDTSSLTHRLREEDLDLLVAFAGVASVAVENSQFAERIQRERIVRSNFERYFAPSLAARIASAPEAVRLGGEKRRVAVLFSDIRGFTPLSETMNPDELASLLTDYFTEMVECVFRNGGTLDKFIGDAVMAQWGAPIGEPDDADRAMHAAVEMMQALEMLNVKWRSEGRPELQIGIGLNYGEAFAGNIGSERRLEFTVIGDTVNTASRLCSAAEGGEILITDAFRKALSKEPRLEERPPMDLRGKTQTVPVYRVAV